MENCENLSTRYSMLLLITTAGYQVLGIYNDICDVRARR